MNTVSPGFVTADAATEVAPGAPGGETTPPEAIADLIAFLVSPLAGTISGGVHRDRAPDSRGHLAVIGAAGAAERRR